MSIGEVPFRKAYLGAIIDRVEVDDHQIRICGRKDVLEQALLANGGPIPGVRSFVRIGAPYGHQLTFYMNLVVGILALPDRVLQNYHCITRSHFDA